MNLKTSSALLLMILLASCATASPTPEIIISTPTSQPTSTSTPEPSATPSPQPTETNTAIPNPEAPAVISFADFATFTMDRFVPISHDARIQMNRDIASGIDSAFPEDVSGINPARFSVLKAPDATVLRLYCKPSVNCFARYAVNDGVPMLVWEVVVQGPSGTNINIPFTTAHIAPLDWLDAEYGLQMIHGFAEESAEIQLIIVLFDTAQGIMPDAKALYNQTEARAKLEQNIINEFTGDTAWPVSNSAGHP